MKGKRIISLLLAVVLCIGLLPLTANAADSYTYGDLTYKLSNNEIEITDCAKSATSVDIPSQIDSYPVTSIDDVAFAFCRSLTGVTIPDSVTTIEYGAFDNCSSLQSITVDAGNTAYRSVDGVLYSIDGTTLVAIPGGRSGTYTIPGSVTTIGRSAFHGCSSLTGVTIPNSVTTIEHCAFWGCSSLTDATIPSGVTTIGGYSFYDCSSLTSVSIPDSVTTIENGTFGYCRSLTSVTIPNSVTIIGNYAFSGCRSLTSVTIPNSVTTIEYGAFSSCSSLQSITVDEGNTAYRSVDGVLYSMDGTTLVAMPGGRSGTYTIPGSVTTIEHCAFWGCRSLTGVTIPNSVTTIGNSAFFFCSSLTSVTIPNSVTIIGNSAFNDCSSLTSVTIPNSVTTIGNDAFSTCHSLTNVTIPNSVTTIGHSAFTNCSSLTNIYFTGNVPSFDSVVFRYVTVTAYYPKDNPSWTEEVRQDYGGTITWVEWNAGKPGEENQTYSITYDFNDKDITNKTQLQPQNPTSYTSTSETITLNPITAKGAGGKLFYEWRDEDGNAVTEIPTGSTGDIKLKAYWKYPVNYHFLDEDGNEISKLTEYFVEDAYADYTLAVAEERNGCTFDGWYQAKKDIGKESKKTTSIYMAKKFELYGQYVADPTARVLTITYDAFGGEGAPEVQTYTFAEGEEYTLLPISSVIPTREGYKFCGWSRIKPQNPWDADLQAGTNWFVRWANVEAKGGNVTLL